MSFDSNAWYKLGTVSSGTARSMKWCTQEIVCFSDTNTTDTNAQWQLIWLDEADRTKLTIRNRGKGPGSALTVSLNGNETQPGFQSLQQSDSTQQWDLVSASSGSTEAWLITNVANGTRFGLAERGGGAMYLAATATGTASRQQAVSPSSSQQQWVLSKLADVNDPTWSTQPQASSSSSPSSSTSATSTPTSSVLSAGGHASNSGQDVPVGTIVGAVIGAVAGVVGLTALLLWLLARRRKRFQDQIVAEERQARVFEGVSDEKFGSIRSKPVARTVEMPTPTESTRRYELGSNDRQLGGRA